MGLAAVGHYKVVGNLTAGHLFFASDRVGKTWRKLSNTFKPRPSTPPELSLFTILQAEQTQRKGGKA